MTVERNVKTLIMITAAKIVLTIMMMILTAISDERVQEQAPDRF